MAHRAIDFFAVARADGDQATLSRKLFGKRESESARASCDEDSPVAQIERAKKAQDSSRSYNGPGAHGHSECKTCSSDSCRPEQQVLAIQQMCVPHRLLSSRRKESVWHVSANRPPGFALETSLENIQMRPDSTMFRVAANPFCLQGF
jgi:hypothetical protein